MAESNGNGGPSNDGMHSQPTSVKIRNHENDEKIMLEKLWSSCQLLKEKTDALRKANKSIAKKKVMTPKFAVYEKYDPFGKKAKRNAKRRESYRIKKAKHSKVNMMMHSGDGDGDSNVDMYVAEVLNQDAPGKPGGYYNI